MTTASSTSTLAQDTYAHMQNWVGEICGQLLACGLKQTNDSGQLTLSGSGGTAVASWGSAALPTGTGIANSVANILFTFNDSLAGGAISTTALRSGGSGYTSSAYTGLVVTGTISGANNARASMTVTGGVAGVLTITTAGTGYLVGEQLTVAGIGAGSGANWTVLALSSGNPIIFRLDFGGGNATTDAQMWINVGAGTNGSGTIAGVAGTSKMTQVACFSGVVATNLITPWPSNFCYNATYSLATVLSKSGAAGVGWVIGGFILCRTNDGNGNPTNNAAVLISNSATSTGTTGTGSINQQQDMTWNGSGAGSTTYGPQNVYAGGGVQFNTGGAQQPFGITSTLQNNTVYVFPLMTYDPGFKFSAYFGNVMIVDVPIGNTFSTAIIGSTPLTFLSFGAGFGAQQSLGGGGANAAMGSCVLFQ